MTLLSQSLLFFCLALAACSQAVAQARATAEQPSRLSVFVGARGTEDGIDHARDVGVTTGLDVGVRHVFGLLPALEARGSYAFADNGLVNLRNAMGGVRVEKHLRAVHPYGDLQFGRGEINYPNGGLLSRNGTAFYLNSYSNVWAPGVGVDIDVARHFAIRVDAQFEHYGSPVTQSGSEWAKAGTVGVVYRLGFRSYRYGH